MKDSYPKHIKNFKNTKIRKQTTLLKSGPMTLPDISYDIQMTNKPEKNAPYSMSSDKLN